MDLEKRRSSFKKIENLVQSRKITFYFLSKELGLSRSLFSDWKRGVSMPKSDKLKKIADYFGVTIDYFLE